MEYDDLETFRQLSLTMEEIESFRFDCQMNLLQLVCHEESVSILEYLTQEVLHEFPEKRKEMASFRDDYLGSQAIHLAATTGNLKILRHLQRNYWVDLKAKTSNGQTVYHCASQGYNGIASFFWFSRVHQLDELVHVKDEKGGTPLHFAVLSLNFKNVQTLLKLGADPNAQDVEGNTALHLCVINLENNVQDFDKLKTIGKELLFSGASRTLKNQEGQTAQDCLSRIQQFMELDDFKKMRYVLTEPKGISFLRMTRPIEKVTRKSNLAKCIFIFDLFNIIVFVAATVYPQK